MGAGLQKDLRALGLAEDCTLAQLKSAFRRRAKLCHPDLGASGGHEFARLRESYQRLLSHVEKRDARAARPRAGGSRKASGAAPASGRGKGAGRRAAPSQTGRTAGAGRNASRAPDARALELYRDAMAKFESFQAVNRDRSMELKFLYSLTKRNIALVDLHRFLKLLSRLEESARASLGLFRDALERDPGQAWAADAREKAESLELRLSRCLALKAEVSGRS